MEAAVARQEGATPYSDGTLLNMAMATCEPHGGTALAALSAADRKKLNEDTEQYLGSRLTAESRAR